MAFYQELRAIKHSVKAAEDEAIMATMFHETWRPTAYDADLHKRMGNSFATHSFHIIRHALRRELLLALMRLWDSNPKALRMTTIATKLRDREFFTALVARRAERLDMSAHGITEAMRHALEPKRDAILAIVQKYTKGGAGFAVFQKLQMLRHAHLAHRQVFPIDVSENDTTDDEIEIFYTDNLELVRLLLSLIWATAFDLTKSADVYRHHARFFWAAARGERTEGHPDHPVRQDFLPNAPHKT